MDTYKPIFRFDLEDGDILHIKVGGELGDGQPPYIPDPCELDNQKAYWEKLVPDNVRVIVTHHLVDANVIRVTKKEK